MAYQDSLTNAQLRLTPVPVTRGTPVSIPVIPVMSATSYSITEQVGGVLTFANVASGAGKAFELLSIIMEDNTANSPANSIFHLMLFKEFPVITSVDSAVLAITAAEFRAAYLIGEITLVPQHIQAAGSVPGGVSVTPSGGTHISGTTANIYGILVLGDIASSWGGNAVDNVRITIISSHIN
jgi:hypothetical protein